MQNNIISMANSVDPDQPDSSECGLRKMMILFPPHNLSNTGLKLLTELVLFPYLEYLGKNCYYFIFSKQES